MTCVLFTKSDSFVCGTDLFLDQLSTIALFMFYVGKSYEFGMICKGENCNS